MIKLEMSDVSFAATCCGSTVKLLMAARSPHVASVCLRNIDNTHASEYGSRFNQFISPSSCRSFPEFQFTSSCGSACRCLPLTLPRGWRISMIPSALSIAFAIFL
jgi:hypothetical protein